MKYYFTVIVLFVSTISFAEHPNTAALLLNTTNGYSIYRVNLSSGLVDKKYLIKGKVDSYRVESDAFLYTGRYFNDKDNTTEHIVATYNMESGEVVSAIYPPSYNWKVMYGFPNLYGLSEGSVYFNNKEEGSFTFLGDDLRSGGGEGENFGVYTSSSNSPITEKVYCNWAECPTRSWSLIHTDGEDIVIGRGKKDWFLFKGADKLSLPIKLPSNQKYLKGFRSVSIKTLQYLDGVLVNDLRGNLHQVSLNATNFIASTEEIVLENKNYDSLITYKVANGSIYALYGADKVDMGERYKTTYVVVSKSGEEKIYAFPVIVHDIYPIRDQGETRCWVLYENDNEMFLANYDLSKETQNDIKPIPISKRNFDSRNRF